MKLSHKLCGAALVAAAGLALALPNATKAVEDPKTGTGHIAFTSDTSGVPTITDPGSSDGTQITDPSMVNPGDFGMIFVTPLEFGEHSVAGIGSQTTWNAELFAANKGNADEFDVQNFVSFQDFREAADHQYTLQAEVSEQFKTGTGVLLTGATIQYNNMWLSNNGGAAELDPAGVTTSAVTLAGDTGEKQTFIDNPAGGAGKGYGQFELNFGTASDATGAESVVLEIPVTTAKKGDYTAVITWTLASVN
ncbi:WxL domain-containing protein [Enterococcus sp. BWT-B8]|uniref:WxL domain-containing protein n=1 Tax=Enterococcus sp. BWT-B8 TaxID=2885157 RepID=UPI001E400D78|nr:WxL domain-containing protein [Enterococcus sp. BWT-B8]MCB5952517.1 WxL domain-containing protein [Enterococcus sp. BWT-B8]